MKYKHHIAVNTRLLLPGRLEGISRFAFEILRRMVYHHPEVKFSFFFDRKYDPDFLMGENVDAYIIPPQARHPLLWHAWFHFMVRRKLDKLKPDLFFSPEFYLTNHPSIPQIPVFHDIAFEHYPEDIGQWPARYCRTYAPQYARKAVHILTVSEFCRDDIAEKYKIPVEKMSVVHNAAAMDFMPLSVGEQEKVRQLYTNGAPYFLFVGTIQPRKNLEHLLRGFDLFKTKSGSGVKLLLTGRKGWKYTGAMEAFESMTHKEDVIFTGFVPDEHLSSIYASSLGLCLVSWLEGFGIPLVEAMQAETPIICSNITAMPEVVGDAALQINPFSAEEISEAMTQLFENEKLRKELIEKGRVRRQLFSWENSYQKAWKVISAYLTT